jgi:hypothetical protein
MAAPSPVVFIVPGERVPVSRAAVASADVPRGRVKASVRIAAARGAAAANRLEAIPGEDVVVVHIANGPSLVLHPETARDLMLAQSDVARARGAARPDEIPVPIRLRWSGLELGAPSRGAMRTGLGEAAATGIDIVTGAAKDRAADLVATDVVKRVDAQVDAGLYTLRPERLDRLKGSGAKLRGCAPAATDPMLVLIHGTFVETASSFGNLWTHHPQRVRALFDRYAGRVYALDHPTLGVSPITNALALANALPNGARLHLLTHSRGGLVAEVLARVCADPDRARRERKRFAGTPDAAALADLADAVKARGIRVERVVRVACPARGTLLASKRLDAYISVFKWTLELAGVPVAPEIVDFIGEVAQRRQDRNILPGLEAQIPDSALIQWLHAVDEPIAGDLRVVAGDIEGDSVVSWLKTLMADAFYWTDNDLIVQTRSMYGGGPRADGATFVLDQGGKVTHFAYFSNERTADAIVGALTQQAPAAYRPIGPLSWAGQSPGGSRAARRAREAPKPDKPAAFVLPGILGSNLKVDGKRVWLGWRIVNGLGKLEYQAVQPDGVEPDGPIESTYEDLLEFLAATHDVMPFAYDWRRPIEDEARRLAKAVDAALGAREASGQPVRIVAHSMGGLVARTMQLEKPDVWDRMMAKPGARVLMLGTPNGGSWAPMQVLSGDDTFGNMLVAFGAPFKDHDARQMMAAMPGFLQLQRGLLDRELGLGRQPTWQALADDDLRRVQQYNYWHRDALQATPYRWGVPTQAVLDRAIALRRRLDEQVDKHVAAFADKCVLVIGKAAFTPDGYELADDGLFYLNAPDSGDGRVTRASALLPGVRTWRIDCEHGKLPDAKSAYDGYLELLERGDTAKLDRVDGVASRGASTPEVRVRSRPARERPNANPPQSEDEVLAPAAGQPRAPPAGPALRVCVENGDVMFVREPLIVGHYRSLRLTGSEKAVDRLIDNRLQSSLRVGVYPDASGTHEVFVNTTRDPDNPWRMPRPEAVIVVGLGDEGKLQASDLALTVRQAVVEWSRRLTERPEVPAQFDVAATLIGSGGTRMSAGQAAQLVAQGVWEANQRIGDENALVARAKRGDARVPWPQVARLSLVELYLDRATEAWRALQVQAAASPSRYRVDDVVRTGIGALARPPDPSYRGADYDFITAETRYGADGATQVAYTLDTRRARSEVRAQATQGALLDALVLGASNANNRDAQIGRTLFQLLVPIELEPFLGGTTDMVIELDRGTAGIPWELLDTDAGTRGASDPRPWAIRTKLLRKLRTERFRPQVVDATADAHVLVIGEPKCDRDMYPPLPGAIAEATAVADGLSAALPADRVTRLIARESVDNSGASAAKIVDTLLARDWRIVHVAGHGEPPELAGAKPARPDDAPQRVADPRGVVLSGGTFLGPREIRTMRIVPELVFVNCCHLAAPDRRALLQAYDRPRFAATVAEELIRIGVRCVVAAGWAVDDDAASEFATAFYRALLDGRRFIEAVASAREAAWRLGGNTWAAYQCYGDPDWMLRRDAADAQRPAAAPGDEFAGIASPSSLVVALETLAVQSEYQRADRPAQRRKIAYLEGRFGERWGDSGRVAEAFARARAAADDWDAAIEWYQRALRANDGSATLRAAEQLGNARVRLGEQKVNDAGGLRERTHARSAVARGKTAGKPQAKRRGDGAQAAFRQTLAEARALVEGGIASLEQLSKIEPTMERESLCASAYKRLAIIEAEAGDASAEARAVAKMAQHYEAAERIGLGARLPDAFYPAMNRIAAELVANAGRKGWRGLDNGAIASVRAALAAQANQDPNFWRVVGLTELDMYEALARGKLARSLPSIERDYDDLHNRVGAPWLWRSVYDQARFVLGKYAARASGDEKAAATRLLRGLEKRARANGG